MSPRNARALPLAAEVNDTGPSAAAGGLSLVFHLLVGVLVFTLLHTGGPPLRGLRVTLLHEAKLQAPVSGGLATGTASGMERTQTVSRGIPPPPALHASLPEFHFPEMRARLPVSPILAELPPPEVVPVPQYGTPASIETVLSAGVGQGGIAGASGFESGTSSTPRHSGADGYGAFRMGDLSAAPVLVYKISPGYTDRARKAKQQGIVILRLIIDDLGRPRDIHVIRPLGLGLDEKAIEAVSQWRFRPGMKQGRPVPVDANIEVSFAFL